MASRRCPGREITAGMSRATGWGLALVALALPLALAYRGELEPAPLEALYAGPESRFVEVGGVRLHYRDQGDGPPVLLLHGTAASLHTWDGWVSELRGDLRLVRLDLPGFGLTGPDPEGDYSTPRRVEVLTAFLDRLAIERCAVAGSSLGGYLALELAIRHPRRVERLVLVDPAGYPQRRGGGATVLDLGRLPYLRHLFSRLTPRLVVAAGVRQAYGDPARAGSELVDRYYRLLRRRGNRQALLEALSGERALEPAALRSLKQPVLLLWGSEDRLIDVRQAELFQRDLPRSRLVVYDGVGHVPMEEIPRRSARDARAFLSARPAGG